MDANKCVFLPHYSLLVLMLLTDCYRLSTLQIEAMAVVQEERDATEKQENVQFDSNNVVSIMDKISINSTLLPEVSSFFQSYSFNDNN